MTRQLPIGVVAAAVAAFFTAWASAQPVALHPDDPSEAREAVARVAYAEAGDQGDSGLAAVVRVILNRLASGQWGSTVESVLNARGQFEPVLRVGGDWRSLPPVSAQQMARIDTIINLTLDGRLPDPTKGAQYFQNPSIVAARVRLGLSPASLIKFGMSRPTAVIGSHWFFRKVTLPRRSPASPRLGESSPIFVAAEPTSSARSAEPSETDPVFSAAGSGQAAATALRQP